MKVYCVVRQGEELLRTNKRLIYILGIFEERENAQKYINEFGLSCYDDIIESTYYGRQENK